MHCSTLRQIVANLYTWNPYLHMCNPTLHSHLWPQPTTIAAATAVTTIADTAATAPAAGDSGGGDSDSGRHRQQSTKEFMVKLVYNHRYKGESIRLVTQSPRNRRNNKETHFKRINTVRCLKSGTSTTRC